MFHVGAVDVESPRQNNVAAGVWRAPAALRSIMERQNSLRRPMGDKKPRRDGAFDAEQRGWFEQHP